MKQLNAKQAHKFVKFHKVCVAVSTCVVARGGDAS